ncbi:MAG TPA: hypothetical protein VGR47_01965 [Terracidiphilus sp.]|nr:hypothetical protein [Terracidiphilus sp.]
MIVTTQTRGHSITGLRIGAANVRRYFPSGLHSIDLELDHLRIRCDLEASFWRGRPEISDPRLCSWLQAKCSHELPEQVSVEMVPAGDSYRLQCRRSPRHKTN